VLNVGRRWHVLGEMRNGDISYLVHRTTKKKGWVLSKANQIQRDWWTYGQMALLWI